MKVFLTGGTGYIGSVTSDLLLERGYSVLALARSDLAETILLRKGCEVLRGDLEDRESLKQGALMCDGVIHLAYIHQFDQYERCARVDKDACLAMLSVIEGTGKPFVFTRGIPMLRGAEADKIDEDSEYTEPRFVGPRSETEKVLLKYAKRGVRVCSIRLAPTIHGDKDGHGLIPILISASKRSGCSLYVGDGSNCWSAVNYKDLPSLYVLALERGQAGAKYNAVAEGRIPFNVIAKTMGTVLGIPTKSCTAGEAIKAMMFVGAIIAKELCASSEQTREDLGWEPVYPGLLSDLDRFYE